MIEKLRRAILNVLDKTGRMKVRGLPRGLVITLVVLILVCVMLYLAGWVYAWYFMHRVDFLALNELLKTITGTAFIAAVGFLAKALIDEDGDGIPDDWERSDQKDAPSNTQRHSDDG